MRHARNRLLFFLIFAAYNFLAILGTTDKTLFLESPISMPFLNIELPLLAFYAVMPLFLLILYFHLLYTFRSYRQFLLTSQAENSALLQYLPIGLYEGALLHQDNFHRGVRFAMRILLYFFPLLVFTAFWFRFADYQSPALSLWHLSLIITATAFALYFRGLLKQIEPQRFEIHLLLSHQYWQHLYASIQLPRSWQAIKQLIAALIHTIKKYRSLLIINMGLLLFLGSLFTYHINIIYPLSRKNIAVDALQKIKDLKKLEKNIDNNLQSFLKQKNWFLPRIIINSEILVEIDKDKLEVLHNLKNHYTDSKQPQKDTALLLSASPQNQSQRNFRLINLRHCTLTKINLSDAQLQGASLSDAQLQGVQTSGNISFVKTKVQAANIENINQDPLSKQESEQLIQLITSHTKVDYEFQKEQLNNNIKRLKEAVGKDPIAWVRSQKYINLEILTKEKFNQIANSITEPKAREYMGLPPLKLPKAQAQENTH